MDDPQPPSASEQPPYMRLPWPLVGAALFAVLVIALGAGLLANRYLRPQVGLVPTPQVVVAAAATQVPVGGTPIPTALPLVVQPAPTLTPLPAATPQPTPTPVLPTPTTVAAVATPRPTVSPELAAEIGDAYRQYWQVRAEALYDLDTSRLPTIMAGDHLAAAEELIDQLRSENQAIVTNVEHKFAVIEGTLDEAEIADTYIDNSVYINISSREQISQPTGETVKEQYRMSKSDGVWRVNTLVRAP